MMDIDQVIRRWLAGESIRAVGRSTGLDRNTVRRLIRLGQQAGLKPGDAWPDEGKLQSIRERLGRPGAAPEQGPIEQALLQRQPQIEERHHEQLVPEHVAAVGLAVQAAGGDAHVEVDAVPGHGLQQVEDVQPQHQGGAGGHSHESRRPGYRRFKRSNS